VFEATSRVDQTLHTELELRHHIFVRINPRDARDFARASGRRAKADTSMSACWLIWRKRTNLSLPTTFTERLS
jgi:hypothetical protein